MRAVMALSHTARGRRIALEMRVFGLCAARGGYAPDGKGSRPAEAALAWIGETPHRTAGNEKQASSDSGPAGGRPAETKKPVRRCFKSRPPLRTEFTGFASGCRSDFLRRLSLPQAAVRPLVRIPTDRHATTGTCEIGQARK